MHTGGSFIVSSQRRRAFPFSGSSLINLTAMRDSLKRVLLHFGTVAAVCTLYGLGQGFRFGETLLAAAMLGTFVLGIGWVGRLSDARLKSK
jgi:hypothetical protein